MNNAISHIGYATKAVMPQIIEQHFESQKTKPLLQIIHRLVDERILEYMFPRFTKNEITEILGISSTTLLNRAIEFGWKEKYYKKRRKISRVENYNLQSMG